MRIAIVIAVLLTLAGCDSGTEPQADPKDDLVGMWRMVAVNGAPLPFDEGSPSVTRWQITGGTLRLAPGVRGSEFQYCRHHSGPNTPYPYTTAASNELTWRVDGDVLTVTFQFASASMTDFGSFAANGDILLERTFEVPDRTYHFRKYADAPAALPGCGAGL